MFYDKFRNNPLTSNPFAIAKIIIFIHLSNIISHTIKMHLVFSLIFITFA